MEIIDLKQGQILHKDENISLYQEIEQTHKIYSIYAVNIEEVNHFLFLHGNREKISDSDFKDYNFELMGIQRKYVREAGVMHKVFDDHVLNFVLKKTKK